MIGTIQKVWPIDGRKPGSVVFSDGQKYSTFDRAQIQAAQGLIGQQIEFTTTQNGQYTNFGTIVRSMGQAAAPQGSPAPAAGFDGETLAALVRIAEAVEKLVTQVGVLASNSLYPQQTAVTVLGADTVAPAPADPLEAYESALAAAVGPEAAKAQIAAIKKRHAKSPEKLEPALKALLVANGVEVAE